MMLRAGMAFGITGELEALQRRQAGSVTDNFVETGQSLFHVCGGDGDLIHVFSFD